MVKYLQCNYRPGPHLSPAEEPTRQQRLPLADIPELPQQPERDWRDRAALNSRILSQLGPTPVAEDQLLRDLGMNPFEAAAELSRLELDGAIQRQPGGLIALAASQQSGSGKKAP